MTGETSTGLEAERALRKVLAEEGVDADISLVAVDTHEEAQRLRSPGSPTIRVEGRDLFPGGAPDPIVWALGRRVYSTMQGPKGAPTIEMLRVALGLDGEGRGKRRRS